MLDTPKVAELTESVTRTVYAVWEGGGIMTAQKYRWIYYYSYSSLLILYLREEIEKFASKILDCSIVPKWVPVTLRCH